MVLNIHTLQSRQWLLVITATLACSKPLANELDLDLESLMATDVQITSAMRRSQSIQDTAASIYVLTSEQILNSGAQTLQDMLRLVPGIHVRQVDRNQHAIGIRFAGSTLATKLLVMIDGHSVYNPALSSTYWELINTAPEDIERIEIIRGQTGTMWGLNALNGVINIITKQNVDNLDTTASYYRDNRQFSDLNASHGITLNSHATVRVYGSHRSAPRSNQGQAAALANDATETNTLGARVDYIPADNLYSFTRIELVRGDYGRNSLVGDLITNDLLIAPETIPRERFSATTRLEHRLNSKADQMFQISYARLQGSQLFTKEDHYSFDFDYQLNTLWHNHKIDVGVSYRLNEIDGANQLRSFDLDDDNTLTTLGVFAQGQFNFWDNKLSLVLSNLTARNNYTGIEHQPSFKALIKPAAHHSAWLAVSRAVRLPTYAESDNRVRAPGVAVSDVLGVAIPQLEGLTLDVFLTGNPDLEAEHSTATELGYRLHQGHWSLDAALFYSESDNVITTQPQLDGTSPETLAALLATGQLQAALLQLQMAQISQRFISGTTAISYGGELSLRWQPTDYFNTELSYSHTDLQYGNVQPGAEPSFSQDSSLKQTLLNTNIRLNANTTFFWSLRHEEGQTYSTGSIINNQLSIRYRVNDHMHLNLISQNPFTPSQFEFLNEFESPGLATARERNVALNLQLRW